ncbi:hypothetical protein Q0Z83_043920 [Actinoplanes sichuanensis]|nr:hypothetical protein Q0Z83_043920 [Actinoplanes sichuanensis]
MCAAVTAALGAVLAAPAPALAVGGNRTVQRSCGSNYISSGGGNGHFWAQTEKVSGNCDGTLSVAMQASDNYRSPRVYGTRQSAYTELWNFNAHYGIHWGCNSCDSSWT